MAAQHITIDVFRRYQSVTLLSLTAWGERISSDPSQGHLRPCRLRLTAGKASIAGRGLRPGGCSSSECAPSDIESDSSQTCSEKGDLDLFSAKYHRCEAEGWSEPQVFLGADLLNHQYFWSRVADPQVGLYFVIEHYVHVSVVHRY